MARKRNYTLRKRAEAQDETHRRITEAAMRLHEEIGPRATTISAIAERAGVQRLTVYRHFPDEAAIFRACTSHWLELNPLPDPAGWSCISDGRARLRAALTAFYAYYRGTRRMWSVAHREGEAVPALHEPIAQIAAFMHGLGEGLVEGFAAEAPPDAALRATVHHVLAFPTWQSLADLGLDDVASVDVALAWVDGVRRAAA